MAETSDDLVTLVRRDSFLPAAQRNFPVATILQIADEETVNGIARVLKSLQMGFYEEDADSTMTVGLARYDLDRYAMWNAVRRIDLLDTDGTEVQLNQITREQIYDYSTTGQGRPEAFIFEDKQVRFFPIPDAAYTMRQAIYRRPGQLVPMASAAQVLTAVGTTVTYTASKPSTFGAATIHDFYRGTSPFRRIGTAITATGSPGATQQSFASASVSLLQAGDWVCVRGQTIFPGVPCDLIPHLKDLVVASIASTQMDAAAYQMRREKIMANAREEMTAPGGRTSGQPKRISISASRVGLRRGSVIR